jgi:hypothetical protein
MNKSLITIIALLIIIVILWKYVYRNGYKKPESNYLYLDGSWYVNSPWQDSWPNH